VRATGTSARVRLAVWAVPAIVAAGCGGGTVIVDYAVNAKVSLRDSNGKTQESGTIVTVPRHPKLLSPFDAVQYRGQDFEWTFGTGTLGMGGSIANHSAKPLCLRFDQAQIRSNFHPAPMALKTYSWSAFREKWSILGSTDPKQRQDFGPPAFCLEPGKEARVSFAPDLGPLFPTEKMFNVSWPDNEPQLTDKGVGNWIALSVPVEIGEKRQVMEVKLTAIDSKARISTY
jgi:hypothetical protein